MVARSTIMADRLLYWCMKKKNIDTPALGCKIGQAFQILTSQLGAALRSAGLEITAGEYMILRAVYSSEGLQQCEISEMVGKDKAGVSRSVAALKKRGFLSTTQVSHKCLKVYLTDKSIRLKPRIMKIAEERHKAMLNLTTPGDLEIFNQILESIIESK